MNIITMDEKTKIKPFKVMIWLNDKKHTFYGKETDYLSFNSNLKHEIVWQKLSTATSKTSMNKHS